ncbi:hypothetical protein A5676_18325 [Mycobacterium malmoense]|nr:hypothetical protein A5676_18325 [Mycobacterium malmoense]
MLDADDQMHDHLNETLAQVAAQGYDVAVPTMAQWWRIDELSEKLNGPKHLTNKSAIAPLAAEVIQEELPGMLNWVVKGYRDFKRDLVTRMVETGESEEQARDYLTTKMQMAIVRDFDKMRESNPTTYDAAMTTFRHMFAAFGQSAPYPFNG